MSRRSDWGYYGPRDRRPTKLSADQRAEIRRRLKGRESAQDLAAEFGVSTSTIRNC